MLPGSKQLFRISYLQAIRLLHKNADLDVADGIELFVEASSGLRSASEAHREYITTETLTSNLVFASPSGEATTADDTFDGETVKFGVVKK